MEVLIAFSLILVCIIPLVKQPLEWMRAEYQKCAQLEQERIADWTFTEIYEMFLKHEISWEQLPEHRETTGPFPLKDAQIQLPQQQKKNIARAFTLTGQGRKEGRKGQEYKQIYVNVIMNGAIYTFRLPVQKIGKNSSLSGRSSPKETDAWDI
ncbi:MAG: hypothetical protein KGR16_02625 [Verrucomicrobia bacterium]|nr:hypothetical protein [Verrucomicrobiota bacterium]